MSKDSWIDRIGQPIRNAFAVHSLAGLLFGDHSTVSILFVIPEAVGSINSHNAAILTELQKLGRVDTITQADALTYPHFAEYNIIFCGTDNGTGWTTSNLAHVKEFPEPVICVDATVAAYLLIGADGGDAGTKTALTAIAEIKANDLGIGVEGVTGLAVGANTISSATTYNTLDMSDADITETFFGTEGVADNTDVLLAAVFKRQPDGTRGILSDASEATGSRYFYGPAYSAADLNALGLAVIELLAHMAIQATTAAVGVEISGDIGDLETKLFGNQATEFNNGNPLVEFLAGRNSAGTRLAIGKSLYDLLGIGYVDGAGGFNLENLRDDLRTLAQYLIDGDAGAEAGGALASGVSLVDMITPLGAVDTAAAAGPVSASDLAMAYLKQLVTALYRLTETAIADTTDPVDMTTEVADDTILANMLTKDGDTSGYDRRTDSQEAISDAIAALNADRPQVHTVYATGDMINIGDATMFALDALAGTVRNVRVKVHVDGASAGNISIVWFATSITTPLTFTERVLPVPVTVNPGGASDLEAEFGDLPEGLQLQCMIRSAGDDSGIDYFGELTYEG
ncbi:hypothetical protein LCGC14_0693040 [marine sediment metagenome]|uniref:Uncharacterized protein n=1 Tax=marine sediment metagenome TaxID=412755 RepID=A0A0F9R599_9ZZZZ